MALIAKCLYRLVNNKMTPKRNIGFAYTVGGDIIITIIIYEFARVDLRQNVLGCYTQNCIN